MFVFVFLDSEGHLLLLGSPDCGSPPWALYVFGRVWLSHRVDLLFFLSFSLVLAVLLRDLESLVETQSLESKGAGFVVVDAEWLLWGNLSVEGIPGLLRQAEHCNRCDDDFFPSTELRAVG